MGMVEEAIMGTVEDMGISDIMELLMPEPPPEPYCARAPLARNNEDASIKYIFVAGMVIVN